MIRLCIVYCIFYVKCENRVKWETSFVIWSFINSKKKHLKRCSNRKKKRMCSLYRCYQLLRILYVSDSNSGTARSFWQIHRCCLCKNWNDTGHRRDTSHMSFLRHLRIIWCHIFECFSIMALFSFEFGEKFENY